MSTVGSSSTVHGSSLFVRLRLDRRRPAGSRRRRRRAARCRRRRARARRRASTRRSASGSSRPRAVPERRGSLRAGRPRRRGGGPPRRARRPSGPDERLPTKRTASSGSRVPPAVTSTRLPARLPGASSCSARRAISAGSAIRPTPHSPSAVSPSSGPTSSTPRATQRLGVRAGRRVRPHARVHRRRDEHRPAVGERSLGEQVVGDPLRELRERVRGARGDDEQVGARQVEVEILVRPAGARAPGTSRRARTAPRRASRAGSPRGPALTSRRVSSHAL